MTNISDLYSHVNELIKTDIDNLLVDMIDYGTPTVPMRHLFVTAINDDSGGEIEGATVTIDNEYVGTTSEHEGSGCYAILEVPIKDSYHINITADEFRELDEDINMTDNIYVSDYIPADNNEALEGSKSIVLYMYYE